MVDRPEQAPELPDSAPFWTSHVSLGMVVDGGVPVLAASKLVGHSDTKTTERWYYDLTAEQRRAIQERMPY